jgi:hypothetical protein
MPVVTVTLALCPRGSVLFRGSDRRAGEVPTHDADRTWGRSGRRSVSRFEL